MDLKTKETALEMAGAIGIYILVLELIGMLLLKGFRLDVFLGLLAGGLAAVLMTFHMANAITLAMDMGEDGGKKHMMVSYGIRWLLVIVLFVISYITGIFSVPAVFLGVFGLKAGAYGQPVMHRLFKHLKS